MIQEKLVKKNSKIIKNENHKKSQPTKKNVNCRKAVKKGAK